VTRNGPIERSSFRATGTLPTIASTGESGARRQLRKHLLMNYGYLPGNVSLTHGTKMNAPLPVREKARLATLESYQILDTASDEAFDRITRLASTILGCPISVISFVESSSRTHACLVFATQLPRVRAH
jgi:hypothetical protein